MTTGKGRCSKTHFESDSTSPTDGALIQSKHNGHRRVDFLPCNSYKKGDPVFNVSGNIIGMHDKISPVSNMRMYYQTRKNAAPELNFDIDLTKDGGEDERYVLTNEPSTEEKEKRVNEKLCHLEEELESVLNKLDFIKRLRTEWNAQKASLCNRKLKDKPLCYISDFKGE